MDRVDSIDFSDIRSILSEIPEEQQLILGSSGYRILNSLGIQTPRSFSLQHESEFENLSLESLESDRLVIKAISGGILHKADSKAIKIVDKNQSVAHNVIREMRGRFAPETIHEFLIEEYIPHSRGLGSEMMAGLRWAREFGPIMLIGAGGTDTETLNEALQPQYRSAIFSASHLPEGESQLVESLGAGSRLWLGRQADTQVGTLFCHLLQKFKQLSEVLMPELISELEINPLIVSQDRLLALDVLIRRGKGHRTCPIKRPIHRIKFLLEPDSIAIAGVSRERNPGRIILQNTLEAGFRKENLCLIKPGLTELEGIRCYPSVSALPGRVDVIIIAVSAEQSVEMVQEVFEHNLSQSIILIPGGFEESGDKSGAGRILDQTLQSAEPSDRPVINGPNCLGIRSTTGKYDSLFIPPEKLPQRAGPTHPVALISQSGALIASCLSSMQELNPRYCISVGNQVDLTISDYLLFLSEDQDLTLFALYTEGFKELDGLRFLEAAEQIYQNGKRIILYRGGRTEWGQSAARSHTAALGGDFNATLLLAQQKGAVIAESSAEFQDLIRLFTCLENKKVGGLRLAGITNAGFECVALADNIQRLVLSEIGQATAKKVDLLFQRSGIQSIVDVHNPLDLTPMSNDQIYEESIRLVLEDPDVDILVVGCVPLSPSLDTQPIRTEKEEVFFKPDSIANRLVRVFKESEKPLVVVVDSGEMYQPFVWYLRRNGIPVFRKIDDAVAVFEKYVRAFLGA